MIRLSFKQANINLEKLNIFMIENQNIEKLKILVKIKKPIIGVQLVG